MKADQGSIAAVEAVVDMLSSSSVGIGPAPGSPIVIRAMDGITSITAPSINADLNAHYNSGSGQIQTLTTSSGGDFSGSLEASAIGSTGTGISIAGDLLADVTITGNVAKAITITGSTSSDVSLAGMISQPIAFSGGLASGSLHVGTLQSTLTVTGDLAVPTTIGATAAGGTLHVTGDLSSVTTLDIEGDHAGALTVDGDLLGSVTIGDNLSGTITLPTAGLKGQIIVNANNDGGTWTDTVNVGSTMLSSGHSQPDAAPYYERVSADLGGGAVGLAPFALYGQDCTPPHDPEGDDTGIADTVFNADTNPHVFIRFYGPITKKIPAQDWTQHVKVVARPLDPDGPGGVEVDECTWFDVSSAFSVDGPGEGLWTDPRALGLARASSHIAPGIYRVYPLAADSIRSLDVVDQPGTLWPIVCDDGGEAPGYVFLVTGTGACNMSVADFNHSGGVTV